MTLDEPIARPPAEGGEPTARELYDLGCGLALGRYTLLRRIATGGMAEVYAARARGTAGFERKVAIKKILPQLAHNDRFIDMLVDEAKITVHLTHSNIAQVYELGLEGEETYFIVMEYVDGRPLSRVMQRLDERDGGSVPVEQAAHIMVQVAHGLDHAHRCTDARGQPLGIVHRDITPQNVLISYGGEVKVIDFGIARAEGRIAQTQNGVIKGKLRYLAPEIALGDDPDHRADLYNCGIVLFEMLTGEALFSPRSDLEAIQMASEARVRSPRSSNPKVPEALDEIVMRALRREPSERYQSAKELAVDLERFLARAFPSFGRGELGDLMAAMYREEIALERRIDARAETCALEGIDLANEATTIARLPEAKAQGRVYRPLVTSLHLPDADHRVNLAGADGGQPMEIVLADPAPSAAPRPASGGRGGLRAEGTLARPRPALRAASASGAELRSTRARPGQGRGEDAPAPLGFATIDAGSPSSTSVSAEIVSALPTIMRLASGVRERARGRGLADDDDLEADAAVGDHDPTISGDGRGGLLEALDEAGEATHASSPSLEWGLEAGAEPSVDEAEEATHRAVSSPGEGDLRVVPRAMSASDRAAPQRASSPRSAPSRARPRSSGSFSALPPDVADPADRGARPRAPLPTPEPEADESVERTLAAPPPTRGRADPARGRRSSASNTRIKTRLESPAGDILVAVAIFVVVACCLILALGRSPESRTVTPSSSKPSARSVPAPAPSAVAPPIPASPAPRAVAAPAPAPRAVAAPAPAPRATVAEEAGNDGAADAALQAVEAVAAIQDGEDDERSPIPRAARGFLFVNTWPVSTVTVDGKKRGVTPIKLRLSPGKHKVSLKGPDGEITTTTRVVETGKTNTFIYRWPR